jgi:hypothetical protein
MSNNNTDYFEFAIDFQKHLPKHIQGGKNTHEQNCRVYYIVEKISGELFLKITHVKFTIFQLNYIIWCPTLLGEMREAAKTHFNSNEENKKKIKDN